MESTTRVRMVESGLKLLRRQGYAGTSWREMVKEGGTPWGSVHHFFPGGKEQLAKEALTLFGQGFETFFEGICAHHARPSERVRAWFDAVVADINANGYANGCPVAGIALSAVPMVTPLAEACNDSMAQWIDLIAQNLTTTRISAVEARALATKVLIGFEGALVLARVQQSSESLRITGEWLAQMLTAAENSAE